MRNEGRGLLLLGLLLGSAAVAGEGDSWRGELRLDGPVTYSQDTGVLTASETVSGSWYFSPLVDNGKDPIALLQFLQHPGSASLGVTELSFATASGTAFVGRSTGLTASVGASIGTAAASITSSYSAGLLQYFGQSVRLELLYLGSRGHKGSFNATTEQETTQTAADRGQVNLAVLLERSALLSFTFQMGSVRSDTRTIVPPAGDLSTSSSQGLEPTATLAITGYFGRRFSLTLTAGARDLGRTVTNVAADGTSTSSQPTTLTLLGGLGLQHFVTDAIFLRADYEADWVQTTVGTKAVPSTLTHQLTVALGGRF